jgi:hypothetical protein
VEEGQQVTPAAGGDTAAPVGGADGKQSKLGLLGACAPYLPGWGIEIRAAGVVGAGVSWVQLLGVGLSVLQVLLLWRVVGLLMVLGSRAGGVGGYNS